MNTDREGDVGDDGSDDVRFLGRLDDHLFLATSLGDDRDRGNVDDDPLVVRLSRFGGRGPLRLDFRPRMAGDGGLTWTLGIPELDDDDDDAGPASLALDEEAGFSDLLSDRPADELAGFNR